MGRPKRPYEQLGEGGEGVQQGVLVGGEERVLGDVVAVVITKTTTTTTTTMTMTTMMEVDLPAEVVEEVLEEEGEGPVREEHGEEGVVLEMLVRGGRGGPVMVRPSPSNVS